MNNMICMFYIKSITNCIALVNIFLEKFRPVDIIQNKDDIWIVEHKTGHLIFEYNRFKEADKETFGEELLSSDTDS